MRKADVVKDGIDAPERGKWEMLETQGQIMLCYVGEVQSLHRLQLQRSCSCCGFWCGAGLMVQLPLQQTKIGDPPVACDEEELRRGPVAEDYLANEGRLSRRTFIK